MVQAIKNDTDIHILSKPQLLTMNSEEAQITVGQNVPYQTRKETTTTNLDYSTYEYRDVGISLKITPHINSEGFVRMKISQEVSQIVPGSDVGLPTTLKRAVNTTVNIKDAETMVIGGMIGDSTQLGTYKVPLLGDIPILGWLFKSRSSSREKTNLYVFITPRIIRNQTDAGRINQEKSDDIQKMGGSALNSDVEIFKPEAQSQKSSPPVEQNDVSQSAAAQITMPNPSSGEKQQSPTDKLVEKQYERQTMPTDKEQKIPTEVKKEFQKAAEVPSKSLKIKVLSSNGNKSAAGEMAQKLTLRGYTVEVTDMVPPRSKFSKPVIFYDSYHQKEAETLAAELGNLTIKPLTWSSSFNLILVTGK